ncbi:MAG: hypothetical protein COV90_00225 [Candidatus Tagabacteria bacterium CG11_big_fil_rev_8_21_14_0_20_41_11]|nr:MAG: hypothetical protein COV90_00225 [Candidatus Tagabacteria bacterium CG11_big_fil_rev_8_21_14_0_20_41_11]
MDDETTTIEEERMMQLEQQRLAAERQQEKQEEEEAGAEARAKPAKGHYISSGEAVLLLAFTGAVEIIQAIVDWLNLAFMIGTIINAIITAFVFGILAIWMIGKVAKGAPKKWYKALYYGAGGGVLPIIPGFLGAIIYLLIQDRKILGKVAGKLGEDVEKVVKKAM